MWGLYIYLIFEGYIGMQTTNLFPFPYIKPELASLNQLIITILVIHGLMDRGKKLFLIKHTKYLFRFTILFSLWGFSTWFWVDPTHSEFVGIQLTRLFKMVFFVFGIYLTIQTKEHLKKILILGLGILLFQDLFQLIEFIVNGRAAIQGGGLSLLAVSIIMVQKNIKISHKLFYFFCIFIVFTSFLLMGTRRGLGASGFITLVTLFFYASRKTFFYSTVILLILMLGVNLFGEINLVRRIEQSKKLADFNDDHAWSGRNGLWIAGYEMVKERPFTGHGYGINTEIMADYMEKAGYQATNLRMHNTYLKAWAELGAIGLLLFVSILFFTIRSYYAALKWFKLRGNQILQILLFGAFASMLGQSAIAFFGWSGYLNKGFWLSIAIALAAGKITAIQQKQLRTTQA